MTWWAVLLAFLAAALAAPLVYMVLKRIGSRQKVSVHVPEHAAKQGTPTMGGLIILAGLAVGLRGAPPSLHVLVIGFALVGFLDDFLLPRWKPGSRGLGWVPKLLLQFGTAGAGAWLGGYSGTGLIVATVFLLFAANAYNFLDGLDWLAGIVGVVLALGLGMLGYLQGNSDAILTMSVLCASYLPFLVLNKPPARLFMGDVGSLPIGSVFGWASLSLAYRPSEAPSLGMVAAVAVAMIVLIVEIVPVPLQIASAKLRKGKRLFPFRTPVHHAFQHAGWSEPKIVALFAGVQLACCLAAASIARGG